VTSKIVPLLADTLAIVPAAVPLVVNAKAFVVTPLTESRNVTLKTTLETPVVIVGVVGSKRTIVMRGGPSMFKLNISEDGLLPAAFVAVA
jgi:hypothetical protein